MSQPSKRRSIQSVVVGFALIRAIEQFGGAMPLKALAAASGMPPGQAHAYLVSFCAIGLVRQRPDGQYELGPYALTLGLAALNRLDVREAAIEPMERFSRQTGESVHLSVWSGQSPVIVSRVDGSRDVSLSIRIGFAPPLNNSASGRIFTAYLPDAQAIAHKALRGPSLTAQHRILADIRRSGLANSDNAVNRGFAAISMPVFDHDHRLVAAMTALGPAAHLDVQPGGATAAALREASAAVSGALGYRPSKSGKGRSD
jgi:DNA-binding IclR family transcriptional regulator